MACKACDHEAPSPEAVQEMADGLGLAAGELCPPTEADRRLAACLACEYLAAAETCLMCGCLVRLRVLYAALRCPHPAKAAWLAVANPE